jgi:hypothetical protein
VNHSSAANSQFGPRQRESNSDYNEENFQNEENLQYEQKEAHDRSPVVAVDESDQWVKLAAERSENECSQITHNHDRSGKRSIPRSVPRLSAHAEYGTKIRDHKKFVPI